jgi:MFS family permease
MLLGCVIVTVCHIALAIPGISGSWMATAAMFLYGVAFSLVPCAMWPSVPKIVPLKQLGTAYSIIYFVQNIGLMIVPMLVGNVIGEYTDSSGHVDFTMPMVVFSALGIGSVVVALILMLVDKRKGYGLSEANMKGK